MPYAPARACARVPNCPHIVTHDRPCPVHGAVQAMRWDTDRRQGVTRLRGRPNQQRRQQLFSRSPLCQACLDATPSRVTVATIADHRIPLAEGGRDDESNLTPICAVCHAVKVQQESQRGKERAK